MHISGGGVGGGGGGGGGGGWGGGGGGVGGGREEWVEKGNFLYMAYGIVQMCVPNGPRFQCCQVYDWPPFSNKKYM